MTMHSRTLASGPGWHVHGHVCTAGPDDRPFEERHSAVCFAAVTRGTFQYRSQQGAALLVPGSILLGNHGQCFECGHEHGTGDHCLSFRFTPDYWEALIEATPGARTAAFAMPHLPPAPPLIPFLAAAEAAFHDADDIEAEELTLRVAGAVVGAAHGANRTDRQPSGRDERRISDAVRRIEANADQPDHGLLSLTALAREAAMSPFHFLRTFRGVTGMTPHQYILRARMHRAAVRLLQSREPVSAIAFDAGFNDLSTFNRRFHRVMGTSPTIYRARGTNG